jgi:hypothetical protein
MKVEYPFHGLVPKDPIENLKFRIAVQNRASKDPEFADDILYMCSVDPLFWINTFVLTYDPRYEPFPKLPFILYEYQEEALKEIFSAIGRRDLLVEKSRDMGATWLIAMAFLWCWRFKDLRSFLVASAKEELVEKSGDVRTIYYKIDFALQNLPKWMLPRGFSWNLHRTKRHLENPENGSVIDGEATTADLTRGDRRHAVLFDEFASVANGHKVLAASRDVSKCRLFNSTPKGTDNAFYTLIDKDKIRKLRFHWTQHPVKAAGLYTTDEHGHLKILDPDGYPADYQPILNGKLRSPWYDNECDRAATLQEIAQEIDIDYMGSGWQFFDADSIRTYMKEMVRPPMYVGDIDFEIGTCEPTGFREDENGSIKIWCQLGRDFVYDKSRKCVLSVDVSAGTGASNSVVIAYDKITKAKILEYANPFARPETLANQAYAIGRWLGNPMLIWESNGPGMQFWARIKELGYSPVYLRRTEESLSGKVSDIPGWPSSKNGKVVILGRYRSALDRRHIQNYSKASLDETLEYVHNPDGSVVHARARDKIDPTGANANHGDRCMADALALVLLKLDKSMRVQRGEKPEVPYGSLAWRMQMAKAEESPSHRRLGKGWR